MLIKPLRRAVRRRVLDPISQMVRDRNLKHLVKVIRSVLDLNHEQIVELRRAWGNEAYSADATYVSEVLTRVGQSTGAILECGSGLTTLVAALVAERQNVSIWSLEQDAEWAEFVLAKLKKYDIQNVHLHHAPLKDYGDYVWYDINGIDLPNSFRLALCDGPAVFETWGPAFVQWRYGVLPVLASRNITVDEILLDDATEARAENLLRRWERDFGMSHRMVHTGDGDCAILRLRAGDN